MIPAHRAGKIKRDARDPKLLPPGCRHARGEVVRAFLSDHRPVLVDFELE